MTLQISTESSQYRVRNQIRDIIKAIKRFRTRFHRHSEIDIVDRQTDRQSECNDEWCDDVIRTVLLLLASRGLGRRDRGRRSIVNRRLMRMRMRGVDGRRRYVRQGRRRRARLMMIGTMMNVAPRVESISAPVDDRRRRRGRQTGGSAAQNRGARGAAAGHGAAGHGYSWKTTHSVIRRLFVPSSVRAGVRGMIGDIVTSVFESIERQSYLKIEGKFMLKCTSSLSDWNIELFIYIFM